MARHGAPTGPYSRTRGLRRPHPCPPLDSHAQASSRPRRPRSRRLCPFSLIIHVDNQHRTYAPKSDFLVTKDMLPRLLVEVNLESQRVAPPDCNRMFAQGASIVRYANSFISDYSGHKIFTLVAIFIRRDGVAERYILFQSPSQSAPPTSANKVFLNVLHIKPVKHVY
jgi:hypothetical protein